MKNPTSKGNRAEQVVAKELKKRGFIIIELNHKTKNYEIDIIAKDPVSGRFHFIEVKYRKSSHVGSPLNSITDKKQQQMELAAFSYMSTYCHVADYVTGVASVFGNFEIEQIIEALE